MPAHPFERNQTMALYNVHLYRELRLLFEGIEAETPEPAATKLTRLTA